MVRLVWSEPAVQDLDAIADYIAVEDAEAARRLVARVFKAVERLEQFPKSGRRVPELAGFPYREVVVPPCRAFYRIDGNIVSILHVLREERHVTVPGAGDDWLR